MFIISPLSKFRVTTSNGSLLVPIEPSAKEKVAAASIL
jgi:hypothetical protein